MAPTGAYQNTTSIPVILDTDIGTDIDDTFALALLLRSPELNPKLLISTGGDTVYRARILAKILETAGRDNVPVGVGIQRQVSNNHWQAPFVEDYDLSLYSGPVCEDGVDALIETILSSSEPVTVICIGTATNIAAALEKEPRIAENAQFIGMHGSVYKDYKGSDTPCREANVFWNISALQRVYEAPWTITMTPLDSCGVVALAGERFDRLANATDPLAQAVMENYRIWLPQQELFDKELHTTRTTTLFDTVAVYLAFSTELLRMETLGIRITDEGFTVINEGARPVHVAVGWRDIEAFEDLLLVRLCNES